MADPDPRIIELMGAYLEWRARRGAGRGTASSALVDTHDQVFAP